MNRRKKKNGLFLSDSEMYWFSTSFSVRDWYRIISYHFSWMLTISSRFEKKEMSLMDFRYQDLRPKMVSRTMCASKIRDAAQNSSSWNNFVPKFEEWNLAFQLQFTWKQREKISDRWSLAFFFISKNVYLSQKASSCKLKKYRVCIFPKGKK